MNPRPGRHDDAVTTAAFEKIWPEIRKWIGGTEEDDDSREEAKKILKRSYNDDGYDLAKDFDHASFQPDSELVDILDGWSSHLYNAHKEAIKTWAKENPIVPRFKLGDLGISFDAGHRFANKIVNDGEIVNVDLETLVYHVNSQSAGHIKPNSGKSGVTGSLIDFEKLHEQNPVKESTDVQPA